MRNLPALFSRRLTNGVTSFCYCWRITRRDGVVLGLTDHDAKLVFDDTEFYAEAGLSISAIDMRLGLHVPRPSIDGAINSHRLSDADLAQGRFDHAQFELWLVDWQAADSRLLLLVGHFGQVQRNGNRFQVSLEHHAAMLRQNRGRIYQKNCDAALGDDRCRADIAASPFRYQVEIKSIQAAEMQISGGGGEADDWFAHGHIIFNDDRKYLIRSDRKTTSGRLVHLWQEAPRDLTAGDDATLVAGCNKSMTACRDKFSNAINFQGFPDLSDDAVLINIGAGE